jgi:hypothetical protein
MITTTTTETKINEFKMDISEATKLTTGLKVHTDARALLIHEFETVSKLDLLFDLEALKTKYSFKSDKNKKMYSETITLINKVINHINN